MDYQATINRVYSHLENDDVDKAVMACLRISRHLQDYLYSAVFLRELNPNKRECERILYDDTNHLKEEAQKSLWEKSLEYWLDTRTFDFSLCETDRGEERNVLSVGVSEIDSEIQQCERWINDLELPPGMGEYDTAAFTDRYVEHRASFRLRIRAHQTVKQRIKNRCLNYAIRMERQLQAQSKTRSFLGKVQTDVNNHFKARSEDVYTKLLKASQLIDSTDTEDTSLLLTQVRRAIKAAADHLYPPTADMTICSDGKERQLGEDQYLNRLQEYLATEFAKSSSRDLLTAECEYLAVFTRRLHDVASKGVHSSVTPEEAKQGLVGLYMFLYNVISRLDNASS